MKLAVDIMGFENDIKEAIDACNDFVIKNNDVSIILVGDKQKIEHNIVKKLSNKISIEHASEIIEQNDQITILRSKKDTSMAKAINLVKNKKADGVLSAGNSAIYVFLCYQIFGLIDGIKTLGFMPYVPTFKGSGFNLLDVGASINCDEYDLYMFAIMANIYTRCRKINNPKIAVLNIGEESHKGHEYHRKVYKMLKSNEKINFSGFVESKQLLEGNIDVVICDGYAGNICLKTLEGTSKSIFKDMLAYYKKPHHWLLFPFVAPYLLKVKKKFDYKNNAGAFVIGLKEIAVKTHGSADYKQFYSSLRMLKESIEYKIIDTIKKEVKNESKRMKN